MKQILTYLAVYLLSSSILCAGGATSVIEFSKITSVELKEKKVILKGEGMFSMRAVTTQEHQSGNSSIWGQPAQKIQIKVDQAVVEIIPYFSQEDIHGVPPGGKGKNDPKMMKFSEEFWARMYPKYEKIRVGDKATLYFQGEQAIISGGALRFVRGWGSIDIKEKVKVQQTKNPS